MRKLLKIAALIIAVMLGWGYWHAGTHASIYISELPHRNPARAGPATPRRWQAIRRLRFHDPAALNTANYPKPSGNASSTESPGVAQILQAAAHSPKPHFRRHADWLLGR